MAFGPAFLPRRRVVWLALAGLILFAVVLLQLPLAGWVAGLEGRSAAVQALTSAKKWLALGAGLLGASVLAWAIRKRQFAVIWTGAMMGAALGVTFGVYKFQKEFPLAAPFSGTRYGDGLAIVLGRDTLISRYAPEETLVVQRHPVTKAAYPVIDVHFHLESLRFDMTPERLVKAMDAAGVSKVVNLGGNQGAFEHFAKKFRAAYPDRFILFVKPDADALTRPNGVAEEVAWLKRAARMGARGIKENKSFGLGQLDQSGRIVPVDDPRLDPYWELAGKLGLPVLVHTGEPTAFWQPIQPTNERYGELLQNPSWSLHGQNVPSQQDLMLQRERLLARHPNTIFIGAHMGMNGDDLAYAAGLLDKYPNYYVDMSTAGSELGRQPYTSRRFFIEYQDRILFGSDGGFGLKPDKDWTAERMWRSYFEFLETDDEYIEYPLQSITKQGNWRVFGIHLPSEVLEKIYFRNAEKLIPPESTIIARLDALESGQTTPASPAGNQ